MQSTSDEAPGLLAYVAHHLEAHHSPDVFHVQHELVKAVCAPMATKERTATKARTEAHERLEQVQARLQNAGDEPQKRGPGRPPKAPMYREHAQHEFAAASREHERLSQQREQVRAIAQHEGLSQSCLERIEKAERVVPKMQATIEFVSRYVRQQVEQLDLTQPLSYAMHAKLIPSFYLDRVAQTRTISAGEPLRESLILDSRVVGFEDGVY